MEPNAFTLLQHRHNTGLLQPYEHPFITGNVDLQLLIPKSVHTPYFVCGEALSASPQTSTNIDDGARDSRKNFEEGGVGDGEEFFEAEVGGVAGEQRGGHGRTSCVWSTDRGGG